MIQTLAKFFAFMQGGLAVTATGYVGFRISLLLEQVFGHETTGTQDFKVLFDEFYHWLLGGVEDDVVTMASSPQTTQALLTVSVAGVIALFAIALELWGMIAITGFAVAGYHIFGVAPDIPTLYDLVVFGTTLVALALMARGSERARYIAQLQ